MQRETLSVHMLYVDDRPTRLTRVLLNRQDVVPLMLRFASDPTLPAEYLRLTRNCYVFTFNADHEFYLEIARLENYLKANGINLKAFLNHSEPAQILSHRIARHFDLETLSEESVLCARDKEKMKIRFRELGFHTANFQRVNNSIDAIKFLETVGFPIVVKPIYGFGCANTYRINCQKDFEQVNWGKSDSWIAESFVFQREWELCALVFRGEVLAWYPSYMPASPLSTVQGAINANISVGPSEIEKFIRLKRVVTEVIDGFNFSSGYLHMELFFDNPEYITLGEVGFRLAGCEIPANHGLAYKFDIYNTLIDIHLGRRPMLGRHPHFAAGDLLLPAKDGRVCEITPIDQLLALPGVVAGDLKIKPGDDVIVKKNSHFCAGHVHVVGENVVEVETRMRNVLNFFSIKTVNVLESNSVAFLSTAFGFGPVSKAVAIAQCIRKGQPEIRLVYLGSGPSLDFAILANIFNQVTDIDVDAEPNAAGLVEQLRSFDAVISVMNEIVPPRWSVMYPPLLMVDSLAWLWADVPPGVNKSTFYFVQDYMLCPNRLQEWAQKINFEIVGPVINVGTELERMFYEPYILINFNGSSSFIQSIEWFASIIRKTLEWVVMSPALAGRKVVAAVNSELAETVSELANNRVVIRNFPAYQMNGIMRHADIVLATPGITSTLESMQQRISIGLLLPFNYSQALMGQTYAEHFGLRAGLSLMCIERNYTIATALPECEGVQTTMDTVDEVIEIYEHKIKNLIFEMLSGKNLLTPTDLERMRLYPNLGNGATTIATYTIKLLSSNPQL